MLKSQDIELDAGVHATPVLLLLMPTVNEMQRRNSIVLSVLIPYKPWKLLLLHYSSMLWHN